MKKNNIIYLGYDIQTIELIYSSSYLNLVYCVVIKDLLDHHLHNPINILFKIVYRLHIKQKYPNLKLILLKLFNNFSFFASNLYKKYLIYLNYIIKHNFKLIHEDDLNKKEITIDLFVVNNWWLLPQSILKIPKFGCLNIHPSKLPQYRGALPTLWSLKNKDKESAVTYILLNNNVDSGKIISQYAFNIDYKDDSLAIEKKIEDIVSKTLVSDIKRYLNGEIVPKEQDTSKASKTGRFYEYMEILLSLENAKEIENKVKLYPYLNPTDLCYIKTKNNKITIKNCQTSDKKLLPCQYTISKLILYIGCKEGAIKTTLFKDLNFYTSILFIFNYIKLGTQQNKN